MCGSAERENQRMSMRTVLEFLSKEKSEETQATEGEGKKEGTSVGMLNHPAFGTRGEGIGGIVPTSESRAAAGTSRGLSSGCHSTVTLLSTYYVVEK